MPSTPQSRHRCVSENGHVTDLIALHYGVAPSPTFRHVTSTSGIARGGGKIHTKIVVMGAAGVGKSAILSRFLYDHFPTGHRPTVEELHRAEYEMQCVSSASASSGSCTLVSPSNVAGSRTPSPSIPTIANISGSRLNHSSASLSTTLMMDILDTSGSYEFPAMQRLAISTADAFILVYSVDSEESFEEVRRLRDLVHQIKRDKVEAELETRARRQERELAAATTARERERERERSASSAAHPMLPHTTIAGMDECNFAGSLVSVAVSSDGLVPSERNDERCKVSSTSTGKRHNSIGSWIRFGANSLTRSSKGNDEKIPALLSPSSLGAMIQEPLSHLLVPPIVVVGNKCDMDDDEQYYHDEEAATAQRRPRRVVQRELAETIVSLDWENGFVETSARTGHNLLTIFQELLRQARYPVSQADKLTLTPLQGSTKSWTSTGPGCNSTLSSSYYPSRKSPSPSLITVPSSSSSLIGAGGGRGHVSRTRGATHEKESRTKRLNERKCLQLAKANERQTSTPRNSCLIS